MSDSVSETTQGPPLSGVGASAIVQQSEGAADAAFKAYFENRPAPSQATVRQVAAMSEGPNSEGETLVKLIFCEIYQSYGSQFRVGPEANDGSRKVTLVAEDIEEGRGGANISIGPLTRFSNDSTLCSILRICSTRDC